MQESLKSEFYKITLNNIFRCSLIICFILTLVFGLLFSKSFVDQTIPLVEVMFILIFLTVGSIWCGEYSTGTMRYILSSRSSRIHLFGAKCFCTFLGIASIYLIYSLVIFLITFHHHNFDGAWLPRLIYVLLLQVLIALALSSFLILTAVILKKYSYLTAFMLVLYLIFRWLLSSIPENDSSLLHALSYMELNYRVIASMSSNDQNLLRDIMVFVSTLVIPSLTLGIANFMKQEF